MNPELKFKIANAVFFEIFWFVAVFYQNAGAWACMLLLAIHFMVSPDRKGDFLCTYKVVILGVALDFTLMQAGVFAFPGGYFPFWLVLLWVAFALFLRHAMGFLGEKPMYLQIAVGGIGGALSYVAGAKLGAVEIPLGFVHTTAILVAIWAVALPLFYWLMRSKPQHEATV